MLMKWLTRIKLSHQLMVSLGVIFALTLALGLYALNRLEQINQDAQVIQTHWMPVTRAAAEMKAEFLKVRLVEFQYLLYSTDEKQTNPGGLEEQLASYREREDAFVGLIMTPEGRNLFNPYKKTIDDYFKVSGQIAELMRQDKKPEALALMTGESRQLRDQVIQHANALIDFATSSSTAAGRDSLAVLTSARQGITLLLGLAALVGAGMGFYLVKTLLGAVKLLQRAGVNTGTSATEMHAAIRQQEATVAEQAASTTEITASIKEIAATSRELSHNTREMAQIAEETSHRAGDSQQGLHSLDQTMRRMVDASAAIVAKLAVLNEKAGAINTVVTTITKVADQTNLLSLNAAIEAEKAGEYGLGFAVVASEIRRLADQTAVATYDIEQILKDMQSAVSASVMGMDKFSEEIRHNVDEVRRIGEQLTQLIEQIQAISPRFESVNEGIQAQSVGTDQITQAISQFSEGMQQTMEAIRGSQRSVELLTEAVKDVQKVVQRF